MGKGSGTRPYCTSREENELRKAFAHGEIKESTYKRKMIALRKAGTIVRNQRHYA